MIQESTFHIDDGGSDLTDRFKYKVHALMGTYDPTDGVENNERQNGNILNAMMTFPSKFTFNVVGKTLGNAEQQIQYVNEIKQVVYETTGDDEISYEVTPRGTKFVKVCVEANVQSATMINSIFDGLDKIELTVMRF
jgi:putative lipoic acid-binding regulatory protein